MANILSLSNTSGSPVTVPANGSPSVLSTLLVGENNYQAIELEAMLTLTTAGGSAAQSIEFDFRIDGVVQKTYTKNTTAAASTTPYNIKWMARVNKKCTITLTLKAASGGAVDANTNAVVNALYAQGHF